MAYNQGQQSKPHSTTVVCSDLLTACPIHVFRACAHESSPANVYAQCLVLSRLGQLQSHEATSSFTDEHWSGPMTQLIPYPSAPSPGITKRKPVMLTALY